MLNKEMYFVQRPANAHIYIEIILCTQWPPTRFGQQYGHFTGVIREGQVQWKYKMILQSIRTNT